MMTANAAIVEVLDRFNARWAARRTRLRQYAPPPWWAPGLVLTPAIRAVYERYLPARTWLTELAGLLAQVLPAPDWVPAAARQPRVPSLPDLWATMPPHLAGRVTVAPAELLPVACALAAPTSHGTAVNRYPEQREMLVTLAEEVAQPRVIDMACGTGQGTWEMAGWLPHGGEVIGVSPEPLEIEMARERALPHWGAVGVPLHLRFPPAARTPVQFRVGRLGATTLPPARIVVCNGLLGGPLLHRDADFRRAWAAFQSLVQAGGALLAANRFHAGRENAVERFVHVRPPGWQPLPVTAGLAFRRQG